MEYRPLPDDHDEPFRRLLNYAFSPEDGPDFDLGDPPERPETFSPRAVYDTPEGAGADEADRDADEAPAGDADGDDVPDADDLRAACGFYAFSARVRDRWLPAGGVAAVASPPETRRQGHVAALLDGLLREFRGAELPFSLLWPFEYAFYRRYGWATANRYAVTELPPGDLASAVPDPAGRFRRLSPDDHEAMDRVHERWADEGLALDRTEGWWRHRVFSSYGEDPYVYGWERDGDLRGYLVYRVETEGDDTVLDVRELAAVDYEARRQCLRFCRDHDSQVDRLRLRGPVETSLFDTLADPRAAEVELHPGPMVRAVDVERAIEALPVPESVAGSVVLRVDDEFCPWNDGTVEVAFRDGAATCSPTGANPEVRTDVGTLSQALVGALPVARLREYGRLSVLDEAAGERLAVAYPAEPVYLREFF